MSGAEQARGPITPLPCERVLDRGESELPLWEDQGATTLAMSWDAAQAAPSLGGASTLVISCARWRPPWLPALLREAVKAGVRPYLLCESWQGAEEDQLLQELDGRWLVRSGVEVPATFLVLDRGRSGWLYLGAPGAEPRHRLLLPPPQARALFEVFTYLFWHEARHEHLARRWEPCRPAPVSRGAPPQSALCSLHQGPVPRPLIPAPELSVEPQGGRGDGAQLLITPPRFTPRASELALGGAQLWWSELGLPTLQLAGRHGALALGEGSHQLRLELPERDALQLDRACRDARRGGWHFHPRRKLAAVRGPVWRSGESAATAVIPEETHDLGDVTADPLAQEQAEPARCPDPAPLARQVRYRWRALPPQAPAGAQDDPLLRAWQQLDRAVESRVAEARACLAGAADRDQTLLGRLGGLLGLWDRRFRGDLRRIGKELDEISERPLSQRGDEAGALVQRLQQASDDLRRALKDSDEEEHKEEERVARQRQQEEHTRRRAQDERHLQESRDALVPARRALEEKEGRLRARESDLAAEQEAAQREEHDERQQDLTERVRRASEQLEGERQRLTEARQAADADGAKEGDKKKRAERRKQVNDQEAKVKRAERSLEALQRDLSKPFALSPAAFAEELAELRAEVEALRKEAQEAATQVQAREDEAAAAQRALDRAFIFQPPARAGARKAPAPAPALTVPGEELPAVGRLLQHRGARYLVVDTYEQARLARPEAARLRAQLVASLKIT